MSDLNSALMLRLETSLSRFEREMARARGAGRQTAQGIQNDFDRMGTRMAASSQRAARGLTGVMNISRQGRFVLQNTAAQIGDIAIQLESGTAGMRVAGQQLPQLLGGFGALGGALGIVAPLLGTVAAIGIPVAAGFLAMGNNAASAADLIEGAADAVEMVGQRTNALESGVGTLRDLENQLAQAITLRGVNQQAVSEASIVALTAEIEARRAMIRLEQFQAEAAIRTARERIAALEAERDQIVANAQAMRTGLTEINPGASFVEIEQAQRRVVEEVQAYLDSQQEVFLQLSAQAAELEAQEALQAAINELMSDTATIGADLTATLAAADMSGLVAQAGALAERLGLSLAAAQGIARMINAESLGGASGPDSALNQVREAGRFDEDTVVFRRTYGGTSSGSSGRGGGGGGSGATEMTEAMRLAAQVIREVRSEAVTLADVQAALNAEMENGAISADEYSAALAEAETRFSSTNNELKSMGALLADMAVNWENAGDVAVSALRRITQQLLSRAFTQGLERLAAGPNGGILSTIARGLFGGARSGGGPVAAGQRYLVGERGAEWFVPSSDGRIVPSPAAMTPPPMQPASGGVVVNFTNQIEGAEVQHTGSRKAADGRQMESFVLSLTKRAMGEGQFDGIMGGRFGLPPRRIRQ